MASFVRFQPYGLSMENKQSAVTQAFVARMVAARKEQRVTQELLETWLADAGFRMSRIAIAKVEIGMQNLAYDQAVAIAGALRIPMVDANAADDAIVCSVAIPAAEVRRLFGAA